MSYAGSIALATRLISEKGKNVIITDSVSGNMTAKAVVLPMSTRDDLAYKSAGMVFDKGNTFLMSGEGLKFKPESGHQVTISGETWLILSLSALNPNDGDAILYDVAVGI